MAELPPLTDPDDDDLIAPDRLSDLERQLVDEFRPVDPDVVAPTDTPSPDETSGEGDGETPSPDLDGDDGDEPPVDDTEPLDAATREVVDNWDNLSDEDRGTASRLYEWYGTLDPDAMARIDAALSGNYALVPQDQITELQANMDLLQKVRSGAWEPQQETYTPDPDDSDLPPQVRLQLEAQQREIESLRTYQMRDQTDALIQSREQEIQSAEDQWLAAHPDITDAEFAAVQNWVVNSGQFPQQAQALGNARAVSALYDAALVQNPEYVDRTINARVKAQVEQALSPLQDQQARGTRASAISGAASASPDLSSMDPDAAMIEELRNAMGR